MLEACLAATEVRRRSGALKRCGDTKKLNVFDKVLVLRSSSSKLLKSRTDVKQQRVKEVSTAEQFTKNRQEPEHSAAPGMVPCTPGEPGLADSSPELATDCTTGAPGLAESAPELAPDCAPSAPGLDDFSPESASGCAAEAPGLADSAPGLAEEQNQLNDRARAKIALVREYFVV